MLARTERLAFLLFRRDGTWGSLGWLSCEVCVELVEFEEGTISPWSLLEAFGDGMKIRSTKSSLRSENAGCTVRRAGRSYGNDDSGRLILLFCRMAG